MMLKLCIELPTRNRIYKNFFCKKASFLGPKMNVFLLNIKTKKSYPPNVNFLVETKKAGLILGQSSVKIRKLYNKAFI